MVILGQLVKQQAVLGLGDSKQWDAGSSKIYFPYSLFQQTISTSSLPGVWFCHENFFYMGEGEHPSYNNAAQKWYFTGYFLAAEESRNIHALGKIL